MPIPDTYVIQYLPQATEAGEEIVPWKEESGGYTASLRGLRVETERAPSSTWSHLYLTLVHSSERVPIAEPLSTGFFRERCEHDSDRH